MSTTETDSSTSTSNLPIGDWVFKARSPNRASSTPQSKEKSPKSGKSKGRVTKSRAVKQLALQIGDEEGTVRSRKRPRILKNTATKNTKKRERTKKKKEVDTNQYRCSLMAMIKTMEKIKKGKCFTANQLDFIKQTPFHQFIFSIYEGYVTLKECRKSTLTVDILISTFSDENEDFKIGKKSLKIMTEDIALLFGLPIHGKNLFPLPKSSFQHLSDYCKEFVVRNFGIVDHITKIHTIARINFVVENENYQYQTDLPKLIIILAMITFFFPDNQMYLPWGYLQYLIDEEKMFDVSWPLTIQCSLLRSLKVFKSKPRQMSGCSMLILYFLCEHVNLIEEKAKCNNNFPRFVIWDISCLKNNVTNDTLTRMDDEKIFDNLRQITENEKTLLQQEKLQVQHAPRRSEMENDDDNNQIASLQQYIQQLESKLRKTEEELKNERAERIKEKELIVGLKKEIEKLKSKTTSTEEGDESQNEKRKEAERREKEKSKSKIEIAPSSLVNRVTTRAARKKSEAEGKVDERKNEHEENVEKTDLEKEDQNKISIDEEIDSELKDVSNIEEESDEENIEEESNEENDTGTDNTVKLVDVDAYLPKRENYQTSLKVKKSELLNLLEESKKSIVLSYFETNENENSVVFISDDGKRGGITIVKSMLESILLELYTDGHIIDWYVQNQELYEHSYTFSTIMMNAISNDLDNVIHKLVLPMIESIVLNEYTDNIFFPLHHINHWTLLKLNYVTMQWTHYDSNKPLTRSTRMSNPSYRHAIDQRKKIEGLFEKKRQEKGVLNKSFGKKTLIQEPFPRQEPSSNDCAWFVMTNIKLLDSGNLPQMYEKEEIDRLKADTVFQIIYIGGKGTNETSSKAKRLIFNCN